MHKPLADKLRPKTLDDVFGQEHILNESGFLISSIKSKKPLSMIFWGPPGSGKTSIANLYTSAFQMEFCSLSAVFSGVADLKKIVQDIKKHPLLTKGKLLFVDEIHRFNKAQQDAFLPFVEDGTIILIGSTAENPSFYLNDALLSRLRVLKLNSLSDVALGKILTRYESLQQKLPVTNEARKTLIQIASGDGRYLLNMVESLEVLDIDKTYDTEDIENILNKRAALYDKTSDKHYNSISALHKSVRGSDPDAALYWLARMLKGGEDPRYILRRLIRIAAEDIGLADPQALTITINARDSFEQLGSPEGELAIAEACVYLALSPKSNAIYTAFNRAMEVAEKTGHLDPPKHILNAPNKFMKEMKYGDGYIYDPDTPKGFSGQNYFPELMEREQFYKPKPRGFEREMKKRLDYFSSLRN